VNVAKAARLRQCGDTAEAQRFDETADHVGAFAKPSSQSTQPVPIRAELIGSDQCSALGITVCGSAPVLNLCRRLLAAGHDPGCPLHACRGDTVALVVRSIGEAARLRVASHGVGFECVAACTGASPVAENEAAFAGGRAGDPP
jgi:hypothetical protein